jgi:hypothetical protein
MNEEEENQEQLQEPDPSQGVAEPDYTLDIGLYSAVGPLKGVARTVNFIKNAIELRKPASQRTVDVDVAPNNIYEMAKPPKGTGELLKRTLLDSDLGVLYKIIKRGELIMDFTAGGNNPKDKSQPKPDDFGPEGPRGGASDDEIMQAYREATGELQLDPNRVENRTGTSSLTGPNPNLLNMTTSSGFQSPTGSGPVGKITYRNIPKLDDFLSGQTTSLDRTTAGLIQDPNFKLGDFLQGIDQELERVRRQYPNIDVDTNLQRFKWQWHHINPDKMPVDFYVGLNNVNDRNLITDTLLRETNISAGMNPSNRIGLPTEVHDEITNWLDTEIGKRSEVITQKISDDLGYGLTLTGRGSRAAKLQFNQRFANEPVQTRIPYIVEYGQKIAESTEILDELMNQFDIFYDIPNGYRLDIDVNTMEQMLSRLDEGKPTIQTLREIIEEVTDGMRIPVSNDLGVQSIAKPRDPNLIRAIDIEGQLRDAARGQSTLNQRQINSLVRELEDLNQLKLDFKPATLKRYLDEWYNERFGGDRRTGPKTGPN